MGIWAYRRNLIRCLLTTGFLLTILLISMSHAGRLYKAGNSCRSILTEGESVRICGKLYKKEYKNEKYRYYLENCRFQLPEESQEIYDCPSAIVYAEQDDFCLGDILLTEGEIYLFKTATNEGAFDMRAYYASLQIDFAVTGSVISLHDRPAFFLSEMLSRLRQGLCSITQEYLTPVKAGILNSILFGDKSELDSDVKTLYQNAGISHILAISGLHVSMIGMALYSFLRRIGRGYPESALFSGSLLICYCIMTGNGISTVRAAGMLLLSMTGAALGRRPDTINSLGMMILLLLWKNPYLVTSSSFYFSVAAILGITMCGLLRKKGSGKNSGEKNNDEKNNDEKNNDEKNSDENTDGEEREKFKNAKAAAVIMAGKFVRTEAEKQKDNLSMSLSINLATLPVTAWYYYEIPLYSVFLNLLVLPLLNVLFICGMSGSLIGLIQKSVFGITGGPVSLLMLPVSWILDLFENAGTLCLSLPCAKLIVGRPALWRMILYYLILGGFLLIRWYRTERNKHEQEEAKIAETKQTEKFRTFRKPAWKTLAVPVLLALLIVLPPRRSFEITALDVGQGDGIYVCTRDGTSFMIDGGSVTEDEIGTYCLLPFLKYRGLGQMDYWFVSHGDEDHISGLIEILESGYPVKNLILSAEMPHDDAYQTLTEAALAAGTRVLFMKQGDRLQTKTAVLTCIYPGEKEAAEFDDRNDLSLSLLLDQTKATNLLQKWQGEEAEHFTAFFGGDLSSEAEAILTAEKRIGKVNLYKVCHHGSKYSSSEAFLKLLQPDLAIISCGIKNTYGHPAAEAIERIEESGAEIRYTMKEGEITIR